MLRDCQQRAGQVGLSDVLNHCRTNLEKPGHCLGAFSGKNNMIKIMMVVLAENVVTAFIGKRFHYTHHAVRLDSKSAISQLCSGCFHHHQVVSRAK